MTEEISFARFRHITLHGVIAGLCPLIPVPFLDDWVLGRVKHRMVRELAPPGMALSEQQVSVLAGTAEGRRFPGCLATTSWLLRKVVLKLIQKIFRKLVYVLAIRDGVVTATTVVHEGFLLLVALEAREERPADPTHVRAAIRATLLELDPQPVRQAVRRAFSGSRAVLARAAAALTRVASRERRAASTGPDDDRSDSIVAHEERILGSLVDRLAATLWGDQQHFQRARRLMLEKLSAEPVRPTA